MRFRFRAIFVASPLFVAIACSGGGDQCLNPIPDFPSCRSNDDSGFHTGGAPSGAAAAGANGVPTVSGGAAAMGTAGAGVASGDRGGAGNEQAAGSSSEDFGGAGGDSAIDPAASEAGSAGAAGAVGVAGSLGDLP
jgi:hypothetical protein